MIVSETMLAGAYVIDIAPHADARGFFARVYCEREFVELGLDPFIAQANISLNHHKGAIRGMHFQYPPHAETKLVRCTRGAVLDVIVDLRPESPTYLKHAAVELSHSNHRSLYVPRRFAHGYQVLEDDTELMYLMGEFYAPDQQGGLRHDDPRLGIVWPLPAGELSDRDLSWPLLETCESGLRARMNPAVD
jgi:dTDP-4-dehydrorhamnose 3,5-epimerase